MKPLEKAQVTFKATCEAKGLVEPTREEAKVVLQALIDEETDFQTKIAYTQLWNLTKAYHSK